jgi:serine/threonine protein kinase
MAGGEVVTTAEVEFGGTARFSIRRRLGAGGMGVVYEAFDNERRQRVALKTLRHLDGASVIRFKKEFRALADLTHPNLIRLGELFCENGQWFFTMDLVDEATAFLRWVRPDDPASCDAETVDRMPMGSAVMAAPAPNGSFDEERLRAALGQLALGVDALHEAGKVHRDIKPSNVLVTREGRAVLVDFGLVIEFSSGNTASEAHVVGTAIYMAPEQGASRPVGPESDWYAVGCVLYEALTGRVPFAGPPIEVLMNKQRYEPPPPRALVPGLPRDLDALCVDLLRYEPRSRPSGRQVLARLGVREPAGLLRSPRLSLSASFTQTPPFVGREQELSALRSAYDDARGGHAVVSFVHGESGLGKSALVRRFVEGQEDALVLAGRCYERETVPYKAFDGVMDALTTHISRLDPIDSASLLPPDAPLLARLFPVLRRVSVIGRMPQPAQQEGSLHELRTRAFAALRELLTRLGDRRPVIVFIDDFQWADADSLALLEEAMHPPNAPPLFLVATLRPELQTLGELVRNLGDVRHIELGSLPPGDAEKLATELLEVMGGHRGSAQVIAREAGGHPLFIGELVRHVGIAGVPAGRVRLDEALWTRVQRLDPPARRLLEVAAVAGVPMQQRVLAHASDLEAADCSRWISLLRVANLARTHGGRGADIAEPYHDRVREAVLAHLDDDTRRRHHGRLADALESTGLAEQEPQQLVRHLEAAGASERAARHAERAARLADEALAFDRAAELYRVALRLGAFDDAARRNLELRLGEALAHAGRGPEAAEAFLSAARGANPATRLFCHGRAAEHLLGSGHIEGGLEALSAVLAEIGDSMPSSPRRVVASLLWQRARLRMRGLSWKVRDESEIAQRDLERLDIYKAVAVGLGTVDTVRGADFQARGLLLALRLGERARIARAIALEGVFVATAGHKRLPRALDLIGRSRRLADETGDPYLSAWAKGAEGITRYCGGEFAQAAKLIAEASVQLQGHVTAWEINNLRLFRLLSVRHVGAFEELRHWVDEYVRDAARRGDRYVETGMTRAFNGIWLALDQPAAARAVLERKLWSPPERGYHLQHWYELRARAEIDLYEGRAEDAMRQLRPAFDAVGRSLYMRVETVRTEWRWLMGKLLLARSALTGDLAARSEAGRISLRLAAEGVDYARAWSLLLDATILVQEGQTPRGLERLQQAAEVSDRAGMAVTAAAARRCIGLLKGGDEGAGQRSGADAVMARNGIVNPLRMTCVLAPGLSSFF